MKVITVINTKIRIKITTFNSTVWRAMYVWNRNFSYCTQSEVLFSWHVQHISKSTRNKFERYILYNV